MNTTEFKAAERRLFTDARTCSRWLPGAIDERLLRELYRLASLGPTSMNSQPMIMAARLLGLDCGPMSGFDAARVDDEFWAGRTVRTNFLCALGHGDREALRERPPRLGFDEACAFV